MLKLLLIGLGGFFGSISRYLLSGVAQSLAGISYFPVGTLTVNILGSFLIGFLGGFADNRLFFTPELRMLIIIGFLGGFTTFSTFSYETLLFFKDGHYGMGILNAALQLSGGLVAVTAGYIVSKLF